MAFDCTAAARLSKAIEQIRDFLSCHLPMQCIHERLSSMLEMLLAGLAGRQVGGCLESLCMCIDYHLHSRQQACEWLSSTTKMLLNGTCIRSRHVWGCWSRQAGMQFTAAYLWECATMVDGQILRA